MSKIRRRYLSIYDYASVDDGTRNARLAPLATLERVKRRTRMHATNFSPRRPPSIRRFGPGRRSVVQFASFDEAVFVIYAWPECFVYSRNFENFRANPTANARSISSFFSVSSSANILSRRVRSKNFLGSVVRGGCVSSSTRTVRLRGGDRAYSVEKCFVPWK